MKHWMRKMLKISYMPKSKSDTHITPLNVFWLIGRVWGLVNFFDPCPINYKRDGLLIKWHKLNFVNPPYTLLLEFVIKAFMELAFHGNKTIMLLPAKTDQLFFHMLQGLDIVWIKGRLHFESDKDSSMQPHFLVMIK